MSGTDATQAGMPCPRCRVDLLMTDRQGIEIDYCPKCRGVWLDRGELDKLIERAEQQALATAPAPQPQAAPPPQQQAPWAVPVAAPPPPPPGWGQGYGGGHHGGGYGRGKHNSWLGRLFD